MYNTFGRQNYRFVGHVGTTPYALGDSVIVRGRNDGKPGRISEINPALPYPIKVEWPGLGSLDYCAEDELLPWTEAGARA